jgi:Phage integrase family
MRYVKAEMAMAGIAGAPAMPKGLRHGFCVHALQSRVPLHLAQRWLGHASIETTAIYADIAGREERAGACAKLAFSSGPGDTVHPAGRRTRRTPLPAGCLWRSLVAVPQANTIASGLTIVPVMFS